MTTQTLQTDRDRLQARLPDMVALLKTLVNMDSGSLDVEGVNAVGRVLSERLSAAGFVVRERALPVAERGTMLIAEKQGAGKGKLLILGHLDTVWPKGTVADWPFQLLDGGLATGPGVGDMKAGLVMALHVLELLAQQNFNDFALIKWVLVPDEELGSAGSRPLIEEEARDMDTVLVLEPGRPGGGVVTARGALGVYFIRAKGCSAHCGNDYRKGASAVRELAIKVAPLDGLSDPDAGAVVNVGVFHGGTAKQVIPGEAFLNIDLRARTQVKAECLHQAIFDIAGDRVDPRVEVTVEGGLTRPAYPGAAPNQALMRAMQAMAQELSIPVFEAPLANGGSDGNFTAVMGLPTLDGLGPVSHNICSRAETMEIQSLVDRGALFCGLIKQLPNLINR
ncbi:M20 family metallopeptidase [Bordetella sp. N]|uniref:M20 family metallopeptidase n=1 Tax=Bordetella sp. N TaxID=1746199 RepID=UPI00070C39D9|nr:M20 family metallopeptidase [Bordetella sp. N]ALM85990.1 hypothetical protein ASB57_26280 [Bordetella sp. N]